LPTCSWPVGLGANLTRIILDEERVRVMGTEITERTDAQEERRNGERTEKTKNWQGQLKMSCLLRSTSVAPFLLLIRVLRELRALGHHMRTSLLTFAA